MSVINTNITSMIGQSNLSKSQNALQTSMERLSSGLRINSAKDDAAGQAIANRMTSQINGLAQAQRNANDGISIAQTAEGGLNQINDNLQRVRELTVQAQNETNSASDIDSIQQEVNQRLEEIDRIARETDFNGTNVLDVSAETTINIQVGAKDGEQIGIVINDQNGWNLYDAGGTIPTGQIGGEDRKVEALGFDVRAAIVPGGTPAPAVTATGVDALDETAFSTMTTFTEVRQYTDSSGNTAYAAIGTDSGGASVAYAVDIDPTTGAATAAASGILTDATDIANAQASTTTVANGFEVTPAVTGEASGPLSDLDDALAAVDVQRSELGAIQNRFEDAITNLNTNETNIAAARSRIEDADYAVEVADMTRAQILQQAGTSVLAQANQIPQNVLSLLG
ncbi:FliC/FljB family flagellin [Vreelandella aquamarina]|uniref:FliC/FljB family flagellin n=1 Tax=Vreelandella aquamarina TaxID=77097 RepID=UPI001D1847B9|nr:FliC/FljB family flagellin [Halomonas meridiana]MCC4287890.1 FliC/FljB family flagellin [Halomonas meridiana]